MFSLRHLLITAFLGIFFVLAQETPSSNRPHKTTLTNPSKTDSSGASNTNGGSGDGGAGIIAVEADNGSESKRETPPDVTTSEQHETEGKANLPNTVISGTDAEEVVIMEAVMFDHFVQKAPAPVDRGTIEISSNVSTCQVGIEKRSTFSNQTIDRLFKRDLREGCKYVTSLEFDVYFNYIKSAADGERPNKLADRVENSVKLLNDAYGGLGITFNYQAYQQWAPPDSGENKDWSKVIQFEDRLQSWLTQTRVGDEMTLNVWLVNDLRSENGKKELNGYSSYPWDKKGSLDGIVLREDRISQDSIPTLIHEVGHWLGLRHTFREQVDKTDEDCKAADTLIDSSITTGLKKNMYECSQTTCADASKDVINYMSYSQCRGKTPSDGFSTDQKSSIFARVLKYRRGYRDGECTPTLTNSSSTKKMMKRSTMQDLVDGDCPNIQAGVADLESQPTNTNAGAQLACGLGHVFVVLAGFALFMI
ncbi:hypothetical protein B0T10DRAFT_591653 [Thelonectria olida]|uniref:Peptidase M43 pregnancy-associated plasma-A domain-containing protein n=1 Tax=Thelonectria olida TaxID=1576542 RepID=A0A9P8W9C5_9HYPO|nr:hypothetical protein B0T10DRAFT_591653 [Thelonectria olida]